MDIMWARWLFYILHQSILPAFLSSPQEFLSPQIIFIFVHIGFTQLFGKLVFRGFAELTIDNWQLTILVSFQNDQKRLNPTVGEPFMAPGGTLFRFAPHFGENVLPHGSHEWLPYSKDEVRLKTVNNNLTVMDAGEMLINQQAGL